MVLTTWLKSTIQLPSLDHGDLDLDLLFLENLEDLDLDLLFLEDLGNDLDLDLLFLERFGGLDLLFLEHLVVMFIEAIPVLCDVSDL